MVPLYDSDFATVKSEIATFFEVFPNAVIWGNVDDFDQGYDLVMMGSAGPALEINVDEAQRRLSGSARLTASLKEVGFASAAELLGTYASRGPELGAWLQGAQINRDRSLRLQYLAGMALNKSFASAIYGQIQQRSPFPEGLFSGAPEAIAAVHQAFDAWRQPPF